MPQTAMGGRGDGGFQQRRRLLVGKVPAVAEDALDQEIRPATPLLHPDVVVELDCQQVHIGERGGRHGTRLHVGGEGAAIEQGVDRLAVAEREPSDERQRQGRGDTGDAPITPRGAPRRRRPSRAGR